MIKRTFWRCLALFPVVILVLATNAGAFYSDEARGVSGPKDLVGTWADFKTVMPSKPVANQDVVPDGLTETAWGKIKASIEKDRYRVQQRDERADTYQAPNHAHTFDATFTQSGFEVTPRIGDRALTWGLRLCKYGYGENLLEVPEIDKIVTKDNRIEYHRREMVEWYINDRRGIEQGFTLNTRPTGHSGLDPLQLQMRIAGNLTPKVEKGSKGIVWRDTQGKEVLRYGGLYAYDAKGRVLNTRMSVDQEAVRLIVADHEAVYPVTIDPFIEKKKLLASDGAADDYFGYSVSISGDTAIVGAYGDDYNGSSSGSAYIFSRNHGGAGNWGEVKKLVASDGTDSDSFGISVSINGDTVIVGAHLYDDGMGDATGSAYIFSCNQGGADNWGEVEKLTASDAAVGDQFGYSVSISGDTVIAGAYEDDDNGTNSGSAYVYSVSAFGDELAVDFGASGLWHYDGLWSRLSTWDTDNDLAGWSNGLAVDFGVNGLWNHDGTSWTRLSTWDAGSAGLAGCSNGLAVDFDGFGLWNHDTSSWSRISTWDPDNDLVGWGDGLSVDFGVNGLWNHDGSSWRRLSTWDTDTAGMAGWSNGLAVDFGGSGLWNHDGFSWNRLSTWNPENDLSGWPGGLAVDFGASGLWSYSGTSWTRLSTWNPEGMTGVADGLVVDFDGNGVWKYDGLSWSRLSAWNAENLADCDLN